MMCYFLANCVNILSVLSIHVFQQFIFSIALIFEQETFSVLIIADKNDQHSF